MDTLDIRLLREYLQGSPGFRFQTDVRRSLREIATQFDLDADTVRKRLDRLEESGVIRSWQVGVNPDILGCTTSGVVFDIDPTLSKEDVIAKIKLVEGVFYILNFVGSTVTVALLHEGERIRTREIELIARIAGAKNLRRLGPVSSPPSPRITKTDLRIIGALRREPKKPYRAVASMLGISSRTVRRRINRLVEGKALFVTAEIDVKAMTGGVCANLVVSYHNPSAKKRLDTRIPARFEPYVIRAGSGWAQYGHFMFMFPNIPIALDVQRSIEGMKGVKDATLHFVKEIIVSDEPFHERLEQKITEIEHATVRRRQRREE